MAPVVPRPTQAYICGSNCQWKSSGCTAAVVTATWNYYNVKNEIGPSNKNITAAARTPTQRIPYFSFLTVPMAIQTKSFA